MSDEEKILLHERTALVQALRLVVERSGDCGTVDPRTCRTNRDQQCARCVARAAISWAK